MPRCLRCQKDFTPLGIAQHRMMHRRRGEDCKIEDTWTGIVKVYDYFSDPTKNTWHPDHPSMIERRKQKIPKMTATQAPKDDDDA